MEYDVTIDRDKFLGGSDIPIIMGMSPFKTRWQLLLEKAQIAENDFNGNVYTEYGHQAEPLIRDYINEQYQTEYVPDQRIKDDLRANTDGFNGDSILEIKTTSQIHKSLDDYKIYKVQLLFYMQMFGAKSGMLAVYKRPTNLSLEFDPKRLQIFNILWDSETDTINEINAEINRFRADLKKLKENPLLTEEDLQPKEVVQVSKKAVELEQKMLSFKLLENEYKAVKQQLFEAMEKYGIDSWETNSGAKITKVATVPPTVKTTQEFDVERFKKEQPNMHSQYLTEIIKQTKGRQGYIKITIPEG